MRTHQRLIPALALLSFLVAAPAASARSWGGRTVGIGVILADPTGLTAQFKLTHASAVDLALGFGTIDNSDSDYGHLEYTVSPFVLAHSRSVEVPLYLGIGGYVLDPNRNRANDVDLGVRVPIGIAFELRAPVQFFLELAFRVPVIEFNHSGDRRFNVGGALGFRLFF